MAQSFRVKIETKTIKVKEMHQRKVVKSGNGAVISFFRRYIGKEVIVLVPEK